MMGYSKGILGFTTLSGVVIVIAICVFMIVNEKTQTLIPVPTMVPAAIPHLPN